jgi:hypothetical protein
VLAAVRICGLNLSGATEELQGDREVVLAAVQQDGNSLQLVLWLLREDRAVVLEAVVLEAMRCLCR